MRAVELDHLATVRPRVGDVEVVVARLPEASICSRCASRSGPATTDSRVEVQGDELVCSKGTGVGRT